MGCGGVFKVLRHPGVLPTRTQGTKSGPPSSVACGGGRRSETSSKEAARVFLSYGPPFPSIPPPPPPPGLLFLLHTSPLCSLVSLCFVWFFKGSLSLPIYISLPLNILVVYMKCGSVQCFMICVLSSIVADMKGLLFFRCFF